MTKIRKIESGKYYHVYSRGVNKCKTFMDQQDYQRFQNYIKLCNTRNKIITNISNKNITNSKKIVDIFCYCLMPNHFHFIIKELEKNGISLFFQKMLSGYVFYFNKRHTRSGSLFGSRFKDKLIEDDIYFKHLVTYIWNNPVKIINPNYNSKLLLNNEITLNAEEKFFAKNYPYKYFKRSDR